MQLFTGPQYEDLTEYWREEVRTILVLRNEEVKAEENPGAPSQSKHVHSGGIRGLSCECFIQFYVGVFA